MSDEMPSVDEVAADLRDIRADATGGEDDALDVRLQVYEDGGYALHVGDSCYDTDHTGYWGASCLTGAETDAELREIAADLIDQAADHAAQ